MNAVSGQELIPFWYLDWEETLVFLQASWLPLQV
jgi:hypothetical protein